MEDNNDKITIDGIEHKLADLSEECKAELESLQFCIGQLSHLNFEIAAMTTAKNAYALQVQKLLNKEEPTH
tara:strand:- start:138 stop:350 length:213 start_codon:yes stop_codon:yes gene_type:complete